MVRKEVSENDRKNTPQLYHAQPPSHPTNVLYGRTMYVYYYTLSAINHLQLLP